MAKQEIQGLQQGGWFWVDAGKEQWTTSEGKVSTARHARRGNQTLSVRQVQNQQRATRSQQGRPKAPTMPRTGKTRTIRGKYAEKSGSLYNPTEHGRIEPLVFRSLNDALNYGALEGWPDWATLGVIQIRYTERLVTTDKVGSDVRDKNGYATITGYFLPSEAEGANVYLESRGTEPFPFQQAFQNIVKYDMTGSRARVYVVLMEK